jgi:hypothetical protein
MTPAQAAWTAAHDRGPCTYNNCIALAERDWLLAEASDEVREVLFAIRQIEEDRIHALEPIPHLTVSVDEDIYL